MSKQITPEIRFPGFTEPWVEKKLGDMAEKIQDGTHFSPKLYQEGDYLYISSKNIKNGYIDLTDKVFVTKDAHEKIYKRCDVKEGDVLITKDGTIGQACINTLKEPFSMLSSAAFIRPKQNYYNYFVYQQIISPYGQKEISFSIAGQALKRITLTKLNNFKFVFPTLPEQQKIADFLSDVDSKIEKLSRKKDLMSEYKKGVMQKIFSQEIRFKDENGNDYPDWEEKRLGEVAELTSSKRVYLSDYVKEGIPFYRGKEITELKKNIQPAEILYISVEAYNRFKEQFGAPRKDDILITAVGTLGNIYRIRDNEEFYFKDGNLIWLKNIKIDSTFLEILLESSIAAITKSSIGSTQRALTIVALKKLKLQLPCLEEQKKIAEFLTNVDKKIEIIDIELNAVKEFKKGLLQKMFV